MTTGWMFVYTIQPVVKPVVSCKRGINVLARLVSWHMCLVKCLSLCLCLSLSVEKCLDSICAFRAVFVNCSWVQWVENVHALFEAPLPVIIHWKFKSIIWNLTVISAGNWTPRLPRQIRPRVWIWIVTRSLVKHCFRAPWWQLYLHFRCKKIATVKKSEQNVKRNKNLWSK